MTRLPAAILVALLAMPLPAGAQSADDATAPSTEAPAPESPAAESPAAEADVPRAEPEGPARVAAVRVEGNRRVEPGVIRNALQTKVGMPLDVMRLEADLERVWKLGFFADAQILVDESAPGRPVVVVRVQEKPAIRTVEVRGNNELSDEDLKGLVDIKPFSILDTAAVRRTARKLQEKYVEKGFYLAEVEPVIQPADNNEVQVYFDVNEHAKVEIKRITLVGNQKLTDAQIKEVMQTSEGSFLSFITGAGTYREEVFQRDLALIQGLYYDNGFIHVRVGQPQVALSPDRRMMYVTVPITEGEQYTLGDIGFSGELIVPEDELRQKMTVRSGELFNRSKLQRDIMALTDVYYDAGYAYANITPQTTVDPDKKTVALTYDIEQGEKVSIERIEISGNHKTRDKVIRRELRIYEGELFSGTGLRLSRQRVTALGFFESVDVTFKRGSQDNTVVVNVTVKEKPTGTFQVGLGFSSVESFLLTAQVSQNNALGWGQTASLAAQISSLRSLIQLSYQDPYFLDSNWIFSFNYFRQELDYYGFVRRSNGGDISWGYHLTEDLMLHAGYAIEQVEVEPGRSGGFGSDIMLKNRFKNGLTSALRLTLNLDKRDNRLFPTSGHYQSLSVEHSPPWLGATFNFTRYLGNSRWYKQLPWGMVAKAQGQIGYIAGSELPISELFFIGGINSVRGYTLRSISPIENIGTEPSPDATTFEFAIGGNKQAIFNFELEFPVFEKVGIRGVAFYDMGNVWGENQTMFAQTNPDRHLPLGMYHSVGFGFRWFSPIGPLRFEWGFPITKRPTDDTYLFEFTIGNSF